MNAKRTVLSLMVAMAAQPALAMEALTDHTLSTMSGADGISFTSAADQIAIDRMYWEDDAARQLQLNNLTIVHPDGGGNQVTATTQLQAGSNGATSTPAMSMNFTLGKVLAVAGGVVIQNKSSAAATTSLGSLALRTDADSVLSINATKGLLNSTGQAEVGIKLDRANLFLTQTQNSGATRNQLIVGDLRADILARGRLWADATQGLRFNGQVNLTPDSSNLSRAGLQFALLHKGNVASGNYDASSANGLIRFGASGQLDNVDVMVRGINGTTAGSDTTLTTAMLGTEGIALNIQGEFHTNTDPDNASVMSFDLGEAGASGYGLRFKNLRPFNPTLTAAKFNLGNIYLNLNAATSQALPQNTLMTSTANVAKPTAIAADFVQNSIPSQDSFSVMVRGLELQGIAGKTVFVANNGTTLTPTATKWSLAPLVYGGNMNLKVWDAAADSSVLPVGQARSAQTGATLSGFDHRLGLAFQASTQGLDSTGTKTTSILLINTDTGTNPNTYLGLRNIDMYTKGRGVLTMDSSALHLNLKDFLLSVNAELATGALPTVSSSNAFANCNDCLVKLRMKLDAPTLDLDLMPITDGSAALGFAADVTFNSNGSSFLHLVDATTNSTIGFDGMTGRVRIKDGAIDVKSNAVEFRSTTVVNPAQINAEVLRVRNLNFYPSTSVSVPNRLGELVLTGSTITSSMKLTPVD